ncbi:MAG: DUF3467 domain-containing protein [Candidatus Magasanikbacteria bacterium CG_4_9_14_0_2_um_filter_41_10]|uniref:DUF3467 domain-containing protein n=1 Tax=Candidatus Magasanikbacteria bacterium CG_4_10_14_0_2_um_filter_41_31 TaxID=1974639 RepID=A0A2M7V2Q3_9BACT|nr:MAG: hypothetical protein AUJ37_00690 [Candidatus Magasanikbacteria bacterium CG1_02_41_34]PIZ92736.1 MAG: DUF3467 domain-containing protein [Candidatus Magasanikbacteria bacterium CG_4_10_14_0_2_um_filter_41_31]PJC53533.1 MAG: DUF3467 domain-containing protein [Candidatus Magasanikbacteria bacterium CG_4_9_14_0_2_um_filter_41_10]
MSEEQKQIQIKAKDEVLEGRYANVAQINHTKEEFVVDFMNIFPPQGTLNSRIIMSPGHMKRMIRAMQENVQKYEQKFGVIKESDEPETVYGFPVK